MSNEREGAKERTTLPFRLAALALTLAAGCQSPRVTPTTPGSGGGGTAGAGGSPRTDGGSGSNRDAGSGGGPAGPPGGAAGSPGGGLTEGSCAETVTTAMPAPVDLLLLVDSSLSMLASAGSGTRTKWAIAVETFQRFVHDPRSAGLGMGLQFFPLGGTQVPCNVDADCLLAGFGTPGAATCRPGGVCSARLGHSCEPGDYERLAVAIADLPGNEMVLTAELGAKPPSGGTPTGAAVKGALAHLQKRQTVHPDRKAALILVTDGFPGGCPAFDNVPAISADIEAARLATPSIPTYAIGVFSPPELVRGRMALEAFAAAGGTGTPLVIEAADDLGMRLQAALAQIRGSALPCEFVIPPAATGKLDYGKVNVRFKGTTTPAETIPYVERADRCDPTRGGWYYDVHPMAGMPRRVIACEASCRKLKSGESGGTVSLTFGCATEVIQ